MGHQRGEEVKRVVDILLRSKKRNLVLVGESEPEVMVKELLRTIENKELGDGALKNAQVIHWDKEFSSEFKNLTFLFLLYLFLPKNVFF